MNAGFKPIVADITQSDSLANLPDIDTVLFAVGFDRTRYENIRDVYVDGLQNVLNHLPRSISQFIYISSTGVFGNCGGDWVDENSPTDPQRPGGKACLEAENLIRESWLANRAVILRLAGIYGPDRIPRIDAIKNRDWTSLAASGHINLIHVADAAKIILAVESHQLANELLLVSDGNPPHRKDFYQFIADQLNVGQIDWSANVDPESGRRASADKKVSNRKLIDRIEYKFSFPSYHRGILDAMDGLK